MERARGVISTVNSSQDRRLQGAFHRHRIWEAEMGIDNDQSWEQRLEMQEWESVGRVSHKNYDYSKINT